MLSAACCASASACAPRTVDERRRVVMDSKGLSASKISDCDREIIPQEAHVEIAPHADGPGTKRPAMRTMTPSSSWYTRLRSEPPTALVTAGVVPV
jgi:hypothetical protein